ncbi:head-tail adaptor protein [Parasphingorhabdus sp.]|uniref:phage head completion protein n=1 Tax=Parasphingorhabdus sp. TaxID=2709688 RepID=UPI003A9357A5
MGQEFSGILRERILIERQSGGRDGLGSAEPVFDNIGAFWAAAEALSSGRGEAGASRSALPRWRFVLRETQAIRPGDRLLWNSRAMVINSVILEHRLLPKTILLAEETR